MTRSTIICSRIEANTVSVNWGCKGSRQGCWARPRTQQATRQNGRGAGDGGIGQGGLRWAGDTIKLARCTQMRPGVIQVRSLSGSS